MTFNKPHLFLDLDETLFHSKTSNDSVFLVSPRPYLDFFLDFAFQNFRVSVWTASTTPYAVKAVQKYVLKNMPKRKLVYMLTRPNCEESVSKYGNIKDMMYVIEASKYEDQDLLVTKTNVVMIDDNINVVKAQEKNRIRVIGIPEFDNEKNPSSVKVDESLLDCIEILKSYIKK
jgi:TFIIF-interacting CTD phosphatase-like protein